MQLISPFFCLNILLIFRYASMFVYVIFMHIMCFYIHSLTSVFYYDIMNLS